MIIKMKILLDDYLRLYNFYRMNRVISGYKQLVVQQQWPPPGDYPVYKKLWPIMADYIEDKGVSFLNDLTNAKTMEEQVNSYLKTNPEIMTTLMKTVRPEGKCEDYDIKYSLSIEVKNDKYKSANFCFEYYNPNKDKFSGIWASKADYIVYVTSDNIVFFDREELMMELLTAQKEDKKVTGYKHKECVGDGNANVVLFNKNYILKNFKSIKHLVTLN